MCVCVCFQGYLFSSASQLIGLEISEEFVKLQNEIVEKYQMADRIKVTTIQKEHTHTHTTVTQYPESTRAYSGGWLRDEFHVL